MAKNSWWSRLFGAGAKQPVRPPVGGLVSTREFPIVEPSLIEPELNGHNTVHRLKVGVVSTVGLYREHNEDNFFVPGLPHVRHDRVADTDLETSAILEVMDKWVSLVVADGMGGQLAGEKASLMAVEMIPRELSRRLAPLVSDDKLTQRMVRDAVAEVNKEILAVSHIGPEFSNMGTTVVLTVFRNNRVYVANIGDSRAYRLRHEKLERLTKDHSLADALNEAGTITAAEVKNHKFKNVLYLYLGSKEARSGPEQVSVLDVQPGDRFLLATDGLTGVVEDEQLAGILGSMSDPQQASKTLVDLALENQSRDNVTVMVIHVE